MEMNNYKKKVLAFDFGASSGRAMLGVYDGTKISIEEIHRFSNDPVIVSGTMYWDVLRQFFEIKQSLIKSKSFGKIDSIGIDTWGVDFALIDEYGQLLENPIHYRDGRTSGMIEKSFEKIPKEEFYDITGNQFMEINTAFQLLSLKEKRSHLLERADVMLLMPDLFNYLLTGKKVTENSIASTTQLFDAKN
ncbi:MAG: rhamnulokinase, partial [Paeniclostridium sp.]